VVSRQLTRASGRVTKPGRTVSKRQDGYHVESRTGVPSSHSGQMGAYVRHPLIERHDLGLLIMRNMRMAVDSQVRHGRVQSSAKNWRSTFIQSSQSWR
jgi:hypothetical protein